MTASRTLFHPFVSGEIDLPGKQARVLWLGGEPGFVPPDGFPQGLKIVQAFRPDFLKLTAAGCSVSPQPPEGKFDVALILAGRHRGQNEIRISEALERVESGGLIVVAGSKDDGIASLRRRFSELVPVEGLLPKFHGLVFWFRPPADAAAVAKILRAENSEILVEGRFATAPGMFSHDKIDPGSRLLAENLPPDLSGTIADFCAGWGYLSQRVAEQFSAVRSIDLYEADFASLEAARRNLAPAEAATKLRFFWRDLLLEPVTDRYDAIVMNPPFHQGRAAEPAIGSRLIAIAAKALKSRGRLFLVANRGLPYDKALAASFAAYREIAADSGFKVLAANR